MVDPAAEAERDSALEIEPEVGREVDDDGESSGAPPPILPDELGYGVRRSLFIHAGLLVFIILKSLVFPSAIQPYVPALKVDIVDLPDLTKMDMQKIGSQPLPPPEETAKPDTKEQEKAQEEEMALA
ncbi:MAG TPA: hypothetical protein VL588_07335, partial [Bdellovibrionota bacterium]|nr:hypothetical protein [Bdellovibrionota bacterium]